MHSEFCHHLAQNLNVLIVDFFKELVDARLEDLRLEDVVLVEFYD